jgi:His-Xaa-Ser system protein HxsD
MTQPDEERIGVRLSSKVFDIDAVKRAAYSISDKASVEIDLNGEEISCTLRPLKATLDLRILEDQFRRTVLDYDLRARISRETESVRNLVLSIAFSKTGLQE